jgi:hypothetical protein
MLLGRDDGFEQGKVMAISHKKIRNGLGAHYVTAGKARSITDRHRK